MLFNSVAFALFLPVVFTLYWLLNKKKVRWQNILILVSSYLFYGFWDWRFCSLMLISSITDYVIGLRLGKEVNSSRRKFLLIISLAVNLGILGFFKYFNFFVGSFVDLFDVLGYRTDPITLSVILPVGISFYTFQTLSYTIDVYRGELRPTSNWAAFFAYVSFFPQLVAGPIERAAHLLPQFRHKRHFDPQFAVSGLQFMLWGFFKKLVIADRMAMIVDPVYANPEAYSGIHIVIATLAFAFQIYCDFSGYSDIAIGVSRLFGIDLMMNFRTPYLSTSFQSFWARWHISLSSWFRDYLYIPLGGNRVRESRWLLNLFLTFLISGLWHGAAFTFIIWAAIHGLVYAIESKWRKFSRGRIILPFWLSGILVFNITTFAWIFFRAENLNSAISLIGKIGKGWEMIQIEHMVIGSAFNFWWGSLSLGVLLALDFLIGKKDISWLLFRIPRGPRWLIYYFLMAWILLFGVFELSRQFIYFQF